MGLPMVFLFFGIGKNWIDFVDKKFFGDLHNYKGSSKGLRLKDSMAYVDKLFLIKQLLKFRMLLYIFFFSQIYTYMKGIFSYLLNSGKQSTACLMLYGSVR
jgi:hypothetical protein